MDEFFIGYNWPVATGPWRAVKRAALGLGIGVVGLSGALAVGHRPLEGGVFEFGRVTEHAGTIVERPFPMLRRADGTTPLLVEIGKHGAHESVRGLDGSSVTLMATRIVRGEHEMLELAARPTGTKNEGTKDEGRKDEGRKDEGAKDEGRRVLVSGEIVDSKCFLGVMVPGEGTTHRGCAALCLRGGIPAALHVRQSDGTSSVYLVAGPAATRARAVEWAGERVEMTGTLTRQGGWQVLTTDPADWRRLER